MKYSEFLLLAAVMLVAPKVKQGYVLMAIVLALLALVIELINRFK